MLAKTKLAIATMATAAMLAGGALTAVPALAAPPGPHAGMSGPGGGGGDEIWMRGGRHFNHGGVAANHGNFAGRFNGGPRVAGRFDHGDHGDHDGGRFGFGLGLGFGGPYYGYDGYYEPGYAYDYGPDYGAPAYAYNDADAYCAARFRSWNPETRTYTGYDGLQHPCP
jgi:BA14K-like protein